MGNLSKRKGLQGGRGIIATGSTIGGRGISIPTGGFDPDAAAFFAEVEAQGGTLSATVKNEYNAFVKREKAAGRYEKIKALYPFLGGIVESARLDAITGRKAVNNNIVDGDIGSINGWTGDGSTKSMETALNQDEMISSETDFQWGFFHSDFSDVFNQYKAGVYDTTTSPATYWAMRGSILVYGGDAVSLSAIAASNLDVGDFYAASSVTLGTNSFYSSIYSDNGSPSGYILSSENTTAQSNGLVSNNMGIGGTKNQAGGILAHITETARGYWYAEGMSLEDVESFVFSYRKFLTNIGVI